MWLLRRIIKAKWADRMRNDKVLTRTVKKTNESENKVEKKDWNTSKTLKMEEVIGRWRTWWIEKNRKHQVVTLWYNCVTSCVLRH